MTTTTPPATAFATDPEKLTAYLNRCHARAYSDPDPTLSLDDEAQEIPVNWDPEKNLDHIGWFLQEAVACGAITTRPGLTIGFEISDDANRNPWYKWQVESEGLDWCATTPTWAEPQYMGDGGTYGRGRARSVFEEAVNTANHLAEQSRITDEPGNSQAVAEAAGYFADTWTELLLCMPDDYGCTMNCAEANAAADLYRALGYNKTAEKIIAAHAEYDTPEDQHHPDSLHEAGETR